MLTQEHLKFVLDYNPDTGVFVWRIKVGSMSPGQTAGKGLNQNGYQTIRIDGKAYKGHRLAWLFVYGAFPPEHLDHINGNKSDNRILNLRPANISENQHNVKKRKDNPSGYKGVTYTKWGWKARCTVRGIQYRLGIYSTKEEAHAAYCAFAQEAHREFFNPG